MNKLHISLKKKKEDQNPAGIFSIVNGNKLRNILRLHMLQPLNQNKAHRRKKRNWNTQCQGLSLGYRKATSKQPGRMLGGNATILTPARRHPTTHTLALHTPEGPGKDARVANR